MTRIDSVALQPGRHYLVRLPAGQDLIGAIEGFCRQEALAMALFRVFGLLASVVVGTYDSQQQVFATHRIQGDLEIATCEGTVRLGGRKPVTDARILVSDLAGALTGGRLFSPSAIRQAEAILMEYREPAPPRSIDPLSGLPVWGEPFSSITP